MATNAPILTSDQLNALGKQTGFQGGSFSSVGLPSTPQSNLAGLQGNINSSVPNPNGSGNLPTINPNQDTTPPVQQPSSTPPINPSTNTPQNTPTPNAADQYLQSYLKTLTPTETELGYQGQLNDLQNQQKMLSLGETQKELSYNNAPVDLEYATGQKAALRNQYAIQDQTNQVQQQTIQSKLALEQSKRQGAMDVTKATADYYKPFQVSYGGSVYNPSTKSLTATNNPTDNPLISQAIQNGQLTPDMITRYGAGAILQTLQENPTFNFVTGQASKQGQISAATTGAQYTYNPITGLSEQKNPTAANNPPVLGTPSSSGGAYQAGQLTKLLQSQGKTADTATLQSLWQQIGGQGAYANDTAHNSQIYSALNGGGASSGQSPNQTPLPQNQAPSNFPAPDASKGKATYQAQEAFYKDFTSGGLADKINAQNTAVGHLIAAFDLSKQMENWSLQPGNAGKNYLATKEGKAAVDNYNLAHTLSSSELSKAYGNDTGGERSLTAAIGSSNSSPEQLKGFVQTSAELLSSKILSNVQQYKTAYGQDKPLNLNWFISPQNVKALAGVGIIIKQAGNDVGAYKVQPDGSAIKIQ